MIMITAIVVSFLGMVFATYLPAWGKDIEVQTLNDVMDSYMDLKSGLDTLAVGGDAGTSLTTKITLGSNGGPLFGFGRMTGSLTLQEEEGLFLVSDETGYDYGQGRGTIVYKSQNLYVEDQDITLEAGAIIRDQAGAPVVKGPPNIVVDNDPGSGTLSLYVLLVSIEGQSLSFSGTGSYMVSTTLLTEEISNYDLEAAPRDISLNIDTDYPALWEETIDTMMEDEGLVKDTDYTVTVGADSVLITIDDITDLIIRSAYFRVALS
jgi:hypothetical protein